MVNLQDILLPKITYFGLSIERTSIHGVEIMTGGGRPRLAEVAIEPDTFVDGLLAKPESLSEGIKRLIATGKFSTPYVAVTFPEVFAYTRGYKLPLLPTEDLGEAISWHAKDLFPFPPKDIYFDWRIITKTDTEYQIAVVAAQKKVLDPLVSTLDTVGLKPLRFEPDASALARLLMLEAKAHAVLVEINPNGSYVTLVEGQKALFTTIISKAQEDSPDVYVAAIDQTLTEIISFYKARDVISDKETQVVVTGELASDDWVKHLADLFHYNTSILKTQMSAPAYNKAYAAASTKIAPPDDSQSINLLPASIQAFYDSHRTLTFYKTLLGRTMVLVLMLLALSVGAYIAVSFEKNRIESNMNQTRQLMTTQGADTQSLLLLNAQARSVVSLAPLRKTIRDALASLSTLIGDQIVVTQWEYDGREATVKISGVAVTREALLAFKDRIELTDMFERVSLPLGSLEIPVQVPFTMSFVVVQ